MNEDHCRPSLNKKQTMYYTGEYVKELPNNTWLSIAAVMLLIFFHRTSSVRL